MIVEETAAKARERGLVKFTTVTGSVYELDTEAKRIRRLSGTADPTPRQGKDSEWKGYAFLTMGAPADPVLTGMPVLICWELSGTTARCTLTSAVTTVEEED